MKNIKPKNKNKKIMKIPIENESLEVRKIKIKTTNKNKKILANINGMDF